MLVLVVLIRVKLQFKSTEELAAATCDLNHVLVRHVTSDRARRRRLLRVLQCFKLAYKDVCSLGLINFCSSASSEARHRLEGGNLSTMQ